MTGLWKAPRNKGQGSGGWPARAAASGPREHQDTRDGSPGGSSEGSLRRGRSESRLPGVLAGLIRSLASTLGAPPVTQTLPGVAVPGLNIGKIRAMDAAPRAGGGRDGVAGARARLLRRRFRVRRQCQRPRQQQEQPPKDASCPDVPPSGSGTCPTAYCGSIAPAGAPQGTAGLEKPTSPIPNRSSRRRGDRSVTQPGLWPSHSG
jgi:hypothetical protein